MLMLLLAAAAAAPTAVDAEHAFARDAQRLGQWTAFRKYADRDAVMFTPQTVWAHEFLKDRKDPAESLEWWPTLSLVSCDGRSAVNTGPWTANKGSRAGYFTTVWMRDTGQWRWIYDGGTSVAEPAPKREKAQVLKASCSGTPGGLAMLTSPPPVRHAGTAPPSDSGRGFSADRTLAWDWKVDANGRREFRTFMWQGTHYAQMLYQDVPPE